MKLWEKPELWEERDKLDSYLYTVVKNHIYNLLKHKNVEQNYMEVASQIMKCEDLSIPTPDDELQLKDLELFIQMAVERMPEQRRCIFWMSREQGLTASEIAQKPNITVRTVEQHIYKALQDLKKIIFFFFFFEKSQFCHLTNPFFVQHASWSPLPVLNYVYFTICFRYWKAILKIFTHYFTTVSYTHLTLPTNSLV